MGFMCSGKSVLVRKIALDYKHFFVDTDALIETYEGKSIEVIFRDFSESYFRLLEKRCALWIGQNVKKSLVATGGGFGIFYPQIQKLGTVVFLDVSFDEVKRRLGKKSKNKRPLAQDENALYALYKERSKIYHQRADIVLDANGSIEQNIEDLKRCELPFGLFGT